MTTPTILDLYPDGSTSAAADTCPDDVVPLTLLGPLGTAALVVLHGGGESGTTWLDRVAPLAAGGLRVALPDARRHGRRALPGEDPDQPQPVLDVLAMTIDTATDVRRVVDHLVADGATRVGLIGFSMGAHVGLLAAAGDDRLDPVVLLGASFLAISDDAAAYPSSRPDPDALRRAVAASDMTRAAAGLTTRRVLSVLGDEDEYVDRPRYDEAVRRLRGGGTIDEWRYAGTHDVPDATWAAVTAWLISELAA